MSKLLAWFRFFISFVKETMVFFWQFINTDMLEI